MLVTVSEVKPVTMEILFSQWNILLTTVTDILMSCTCNKILIPNTEVKATDMCLLALSAPFQFCFTSGTVEALGNLVIVHKS